MITINTVSENKIDEFKKFIYALNHEKKAEYKDLLERYGLLSSKIYLHAISNNQYVTVVLHEVQPGRNVDMSAFQKSQHPFDLWFKSHLKATHDRHWDETAERTLPELLCDVSV